jgi:hypothetical protein
MEYTFKKWRTLRNKFSLAMIIPIFSLCLFSAYYVAGQYNDFLKEVTHKSDLEKMVTLNSLKLEVERETQSMRSFYLGVQNFDHLRLQKEFTEKAIDKFKKEFANYPKATQGLTSKVLSNLSIARDQVLSGQSRWPETQKIMDDASSWLSSFTPAYSNIDRVYPHKFQLDKLQEGVTSARDLKNNLSFVIVRDMPLNSIQFSKLISSFERAQYLHKQVAEFLLSGVDRMKFLYNQQIIMWGKITADYEKTLETIEQGRYGIRLPNLIKRFERLEKSQMAPVALKKDSIIVGAQKSLEKARASFLFSFLWVSALVVICIRLTWSSYRKGLFYLASSFSGHDIKIITEKMHKNKIVPIEKISSKEEDYLANNHKYIA